MPRQLTYENYTMLAAGATKTFQVEDNTIDVYNLIPDGGSITLGANLTISPTGTPVENQKFTFNYGGGVTFADGNVLTIFGVTLDLNQALAAYKIECQYVSAAWEVKIFPADDGSGTNHLDGADLFENSISNAKIPADTIYPNRLKNTTRGYALRGGATGITEYFSAESANAFLMGDGTDLTSQVLSGDVTVSAGGVTAIGAGKVTPAMLLNTPIEYKTAELTMTTAQILLLNGTPLTVIAAPGTGFFIDIISATSQLTFAAAAYTANTTMALTNGGIAILQDAAAMLGTFNKITKFEAPTAATAGQTQIIEDTAVQIEVPAGIPATGDSGIKVQVIYAIRAI